MSYSKYLIVGILLLSTSISAKQGYYRYPAIHNDQVVFTAEGDLWRTTLAGGAAIRLTSNIAEEREAAISNDGKWLAFLANYQGTAEVYVMPLAGGVTKRVSFENSGTKLHGWTNNGQILYSSNNRVGPTGNWTLKTVDPKTLNNKSIPLADAVEGSVDSAGEMIYFTQFGLQLSNDNARVYRGGAMGQMWQYQLNSANEAKLLTADHEASVRRPMYFNNRIYFISDASGRENLWSMATDGSDKKQLTDHKDWSVRSASLHNGYIAYQLGADIHVLNLTTMNDRKLSIALTSDFKYLRQRWVNKPLQYLNSANMAGDYKKVVITARGRVAIAAVDNSRLVEINTPKDSRTRSAILSHDGKWVYAINNASGEMELWRFAADGSDNGKQLTTDGSTYRWQLSLSPNGKYIAHDDQNGDLWLLNLINGKQRKVLTKGGGLSPYADLVWSPNSDLIAVTRSHQDNERSHVVLLSIADKQQKILTSDKYNSYSPTFSHDGAWLYFLSDRYFNANPSSPWGDRNMGAAFDRRTEIFAYALNKRAAFPFATPNELMSNKKAINKKNKTKQKTTMVDWRNITDRLWQVPVDSGNYQNLQANKDYLYVIDRITEPKAKPSLKAIKFEPAPTIKQVTNDVANYQLSDDGQSLFVQKTAGNKMFIVSAGASFPKDLKNKTVNTNDWKLLIDPLLEWQQLFFDAWIMHRDSLFDRDMRGVDWQAIRKKYQPLLARLTSRNELNDIFKQMMGELNALHSQIRSGDLPRDKDRPQPALLGASMSQSSKGVSIDHIYQYDNELPSQASPLLKPGVDVKNGDIVIAVNGKKITTQADVYHALLNQAGKQVLLELKRGKNQFKTVVVPVNARQDGRLRYRDWVTNNRSKVEKSSDDIGYLHIYAMGGNDIADFAREFYAAYQKGGLIIDVRRNRGGNIDSWIIEKLLRRAWMFWQAPIGSPNANMQQTFRGHLVVLADQMTYSDGETFTAGIKALELAPVIGKRTAGAGVWLRGLNSLSDRGMARVAEFPQYAMDGRWIVEGFGVEPTIEVDNLPYATFNGKDAQLDAAIKYLKDKLKSDPINPLKAQPFPEQGKEAEDILAQ
ncbi:MAG: S41 family peptidase [Kangiellaceae bacterium]|jgi:tricorn protease|nr:S41 family peptidase [Kangiellaceae bacterium]